MYQPGKGNATTAAMRAVYRPPDRRLLLELVQLCPESVTRPFRTPALGGVARMGPVEIYSPLLERAMAFVWLR